MMDPEHQEFRDDCLAILREQTEGKRVHRRRFLQALAALGIAPAALRFTPVAEAPADDAEATGGEAPA